MLVRGETEFTRRELQLDKKSQKMRYAGMQDTMLFQVYTMPYRNFYLCRNALAKIQWVFKANYHLPNH